ncbi:NAD-P-binding protein [Gloeopeniophorella convolvens]|nr:NAD-P-binding protein [Gloeopeniophorella convolvens]
MAGQTAAQPTIVLPGGYELSQLRGTDEDPIVTQHHSVYPSLDPTPFFSTQAYAGKVAFVTGASRGIGAEIAVYYARAGAAVTITARTSLAQTKERILAAVPTAKVLEIPVDVADPEQVGAAVEATVKEFGRLDIAVANAGTAQQNGLRIGDIDPNVWWETVEVNLRGTFNTAHYTLPHLETAHGYFVATSSNAAQIRLPTASDYSGSKFAIGRLIEMIAIEYPSVKAFAMHPGGVSTELTSSSSLPRELFIDPPELSASFTLHLASGKADWLNGCYVSANWDIDELERDWKAKVLEKSAFVNKLHLPA